MASLKEVLLLIHWSGFKHVLRILANSIKRDIADRAYQKANQSTYNQSSISPGNNIQSIQKTETGALITFQNAQLELTFITPDCVRIAWEPGLQPIPYAIIKKDIPVVDYSLTQTEEGWQFTSSSLGVHIQSDGSLLFKDHQNKVIRKEYPPHFQGNPNNPAWQSKADLKPEECVYGLGQQSSPFNLRNTNHRIWNNDPGGNYGPGYDPLYMPLPIYFSLQSIGSYLLFYENSYAAQIQFGNIEKDDQSRKTKNLDQEFIIANFKGGQLRYYFIIGSPHQVLERFAELSGYPAMPPLWSLGYHQCRWGYENENQIREVVKGFKDHQMPLSAIHLDIDYLDGYRVFTINKERFPDLAKLSSTLYQDDIQLVTIIDPGIKRDLEYRLYQEGLQGGFFCKQPDAEPVIGMVWAGWSVFPDFTDPKARQWWGKQYKTLFDQGVNGFWHDMNEPASFNAWGDTALPLSTQHHLEGRGGDHLEAHNLYGLLMNQAAYESLRSINPRKRPWILSRSGWLSNQRYAWSWTADAEASWRSLKMAISSVLGTSLSGQPYSGPDIGGFRGEPSPELYTRFFQMATFLPFFRTHSAVDTKPREPWVFGEPYTSIIRQHLNIRYQLLPYLYTLAWEAHTKGLPLIRPLFWNDTDDVQLWEVDDAFLLGNHLLIAPVLQASSQEREIQLPSGEWIDLWNETHYEGPAKVTVPTCLEEIPVLVKSGSIIPMQKEGKLALNISIPKTETYSNESHLAGNLYSDEGDGYGEWRLDSFYLQKGRNNELTITWESEGKFPFPYQEIELKFLDFKPKTIHVDGQEKSIIGNVIMVRKFKKTQFS